MEQIQIGTYRPGNTEVRMLSHMFCCTRCYRLRLPTLIKHRLGDQRKIIVSMTLRSCAALWTSRAAATTPGSASQFPQEAARMRLLRLIRASYPASYGVYRARRVFLDLREAGETCSRHRNSFSSRRRQPGRLRGRCKARLTVCLLILVGAFCACHGLGRAGNVRGL